MKKPSSPTELINQVRRHYREPQLADDDLPVLRPQKILRALGESTVSKEGQWKAIELSSWAGVGVAAGIGVMALLATGTANDDGPASSPWLDMPTLEVIPL